MRRETTLEEKEYYLFTYYDIINPEQSEWTQEFYNSLDENGKWEFMKEIEDVSLPVIQPPFWDNITLDTLSLIYDTFPEIKEFKFEGIKNPIIMGEMYILTLMFSVVTLLIAGTSCMDNQQL